METEVDSSEGHFCTEESYEPIEQKGVELCCCDGHADKYLRVLGRPCLHPLQIEELRAEPCCTMFAKNRIF